MCNPTDKKTDYEMLLEDYKQLLADWDELANYMTRSIVQNKKLREALAQQPAACKSRVEQVVQEVLAEHEGDEAFDFLKAVVGKIVTRMTE